MRSKPWTDEEEELLIREYGRIPLKRLRELLGRSSDSMQSKASHLGISSPKLEETLKLLCEDCAHDLSTCGRDSRKCLAEARLYLRSLANERMNIPPCDEYGVGGVQ